MGHEQGKDESEILKILERAQHDLFVLQRFLDKSRKLYH